MMRKTSTNGSNHWERRARGLNRELDRMMWERMLKILPAPTPVKEPANMQSATAS